MPTSDARPRDAGNPTARRDPGARPDRGDCRRLLRQATDRRRCRRGQDRAARGRSAPRPGGRRRGDGPPPGDDGALFRFLHTGQRSVVAIEPPAELLATADIVLTGRSGNRSGIDSAALAAAHPELIVVSITPYGTTGPLADEADDDLFLQTRCSSIAGRGEKSGAPVVAGGQLIDWTAGATAAVCAILGLRRRDITGLGDHVDVSKLEVGVIIFNGFRGRVGADGTGAEASESDRRSAPPSSRPRTAGSESARSPARSSPASPT